MLTLRAIAGQTWSLMGQAEPPPFLGPAETDLWPYRSRTAALLRRYARVSIEVGRLPSLLGRDIFRSRLTSYSMKNFEDAVIFVADMERSLDQLSELDRKVLAMNILEDYTIPEVSRLLCHPQRTVERQLQEALDQLSRVLLKCGLLERVPYC
jgi:DNA-directed RNA polymerase specialized sigma24 family protein